MALAQFDARYSLALVFCASVGITGALLQGTRGGALLLRGSGRLAYDERVAARLATVYPGLLPSRAKITGWRELPDENG